MNWVKEKKEKTMKLERYTNQLECRYVEALNELAQISAGLIFADQPDSWPHGTKLQDRAARFLATRKELDRDSRPKWIW